MTAAAGELVISGSAQSYYATFKVSVSNGEGGTVFGSGAEATFSTYGVEETEPEFRVNVGGIGSHDTELGRQRAAAYLKACDIADACEEAYKNYTDNRIIGTFTYVANELGLPFSTHVRDGATVAVFIEEGES